jgi:hypothetical protein
MQKNNFFHIDLSNSGGIMRRMLVSLVLVVALIGVAVATEQAETPIPWVDSFDQAMKDAQKSNQHVLVNFWTPT